MKSKSSPSRRDFLKLSSLLPIGLASRPWMKRLAAPGGRQNVLVVVFDAFSAYNISLYGYARETTPNLARLAQRAIVYHNHFAGGNFTTPGTASLLTGTLPWTHRAFLKNGQVAKAFLSRSVFSAFKDYYRIAYTHNSWAYTLLRQFQSDIDELVPRSKLFLASVDSLVETLFNRDQDIAAVSWIRNVNTKHTGYGYSLFLSHLYEGLQATQDEALKRLYPRGIPSTGAIGSDYLLETGIDWTANRLKAIPQPFFAYFHFLPPHDPYHTSLEFYNRFKSDSYKPPDKPVDIFAHKTAPNAVESRRDYDEYILYVDQQFGRLYDALRASGLLDNTWLVFTSDHGEMLERGIVGHVTEVLYQPVVRVPLLIFEPGKDAGVDIRTSTSAVDVLPTLAQLTGHTLPDWREGFVLPPFAPGEPDVNRNIYALQARTNGQYAPLTEASTILVKGRYKLHFYFGYTALGIEELVKLYDIEADPEELADLSTSRKDVAAELVRELKSKLAQVNQPYL